MFSFHWFVHIFCEPMFYQTGFSALFDFLIEHSCQEWVFSHVKHWVLQANNIARILNQTWCIVDIVEIIGSDVVGQKYAAPFSWTNVVQIYEHIVYGFGEPVRNILNLVNSYKVRLGSVNLPSFIKCIWYEYSGRLHQMNCNIRVSYFFNCIKRWFNALILKIFVQWPLVCIAHNEREKYPQ